MHVTHIIPRVYWKNTVNGRSASIYGACPWYSETEKADWVRIQKGWTFEWSNGTVGHKVFETEEEATDYANKINSERIEEVKAHEVKFPEHADRCSCLLSTIKLFAMVS